MKVGILTYIGTQSHGCCLQAYALKSLLEAQGVDAEIVNYHCREIDWAVKGCKLPKNRKGIKKKIGSALRLPILSKRWDKFKAFETEYLGINYPEFKVDNPERYDYFVVGSDQVWNTDINGGDLTFFLDFTDDSKKKLTYAASLGLDEFPEKYRDRCYELISDFSRLYVREQSLKDLLLNYDNKLSVTRVLDPTLVLPREKWKSFIGSRPVKDKYLFVHLPQQGKDVMDKIKKIAEERNLKVIYASTPIKRIDGVVCKWTVSPTEYLNYMYYADIVVTGSFHSLCFSIIFNKEFYCTASMIAERATRLTNLMEMAGCGDRLLTNYESLQGKTVDSKLYENLDMYRDISAKAIKDMCESL